MNLANIQLLSLSTKAITTVLGIIQSLLVVRFLSPAQFGLVGLVMSIGAVVGVSQHLGVVESAIREIAVRKNKRDIGKVFWVSNAIRQLVTIPLSLLLVLLAQPIAEGIYGRPEIIPYMYMFAAVLVLQGVEGVFGATLTGMKQFVSLYIVQVITAVLNVFVFGFLTWQFGVTGFFWAMILMSGVAIALFLFHIRKKLLGYLQLPAWSDMQALGKNLLRIGVFMYVSRIFFVLWQRLPILLLGVVLASEELGFLNVSLTFGSKLTIVAMALSEVNLSWMSSLFVEGRGEFVRQVTRNMHRLLVFMMLVTMVLLFFVPEILWIIGTQYLPAQPLILLVTSAFFLYALTDIGTSSVFVAADHPRLRMVTFGAMTLISGLLMIWVLVARPDALLAAAAMLAGATLAYAIMVTVAYRTFGIKLISPHLAVLLLALVLSVVWLYFDQTLLWRIVMFVLLSAYVLWEAHRNKLLPDIKKIIQQYWAPRFVKDSSQKEPYKLEAKSYPAFGGTPPTGGGKLNIVCFAGAAFDEPSWTNRQHIASRLAERHPVLYVEPRLWIIRYIAKHWRNPKVILSFLRRTFWYEKRHENLYIKSQWNLIPGSRESSVIGWFNHYLNRYCVLQTAWWLGFRTNKQVAWFYDTEAAEYLSAFRKATVVYDCVDDHATQAGVDRNPRKSRKEEKAILRRADLVTVTSKRLLKTKRRHVENIHLVLNAGDVELYQKPVSPNIQQEVADRLNGISHPILGSVGALDSYKVDFDMLVEAAKTHPEWNFVFVGTPVVDRKTEALRKLTALPNVRILGAVPREKAPAYVKYFDVCLIPYRSSRYNAASFPLKFWEFMATGKPIVVSGLPELKGYSPLIGYAKSNQEFIRLVEEWLEHPAKQMKHRIALAREHSWEWRAKKLLRLLYATLEEKDDEKG